MRWHSEVQALFVPPFNISNNLNNLTSFFLPVEIMSKHMASLFLFFFLSFFFFILHTLITITEGLCEGSEVGVPKIIGRLSLRAEWGT